MDVKPDQSEADVESDSDVGLIVSHALLSADKQLDHSRNAWIVDFGATCHSVMMVVNSNR